LLAAPDPGARPERFLDKRQLHANGNARTVKTRVIPELKRKRSR
jgi:hypothetical protein